MGVRARSFSGRKAQVTIFIILGILILLSAALLLLLRSEQIGFNITEIIPTEKGVVETYVSNCIIQIGEEGLDLIGLQGGFIEVPERYTSDFNWHIAASDFLYVPLWASGNVVDQPSLDEIKIDLDEYIEENVRNCLFENDESFEESYNLIELDDIFSDVKFEEEFTDFDVTWDIVVQDKSGEVVSEIIQHNARSNVQFKTMHETATNILETEMLELKLEDITQDLIALEHDNLPVSGMELSCAPKQWSEETVKETLKEMLRINIRALRVEGSSFTEYSDLFPYYQNHYVWNLLDEVSEDMEVTFRFEDTYPFTFQVTPTSGGIMSSDQMGGSSLLDFLCIQNWKFTYDVVYPIMVQVFDEDTGAVLQMGISVNLLQNYPNKEETVYARESHISGINVNEKEYCQESVYALPISITTYSEISTGASGVYYREALEDVNLSYTCIKYTCDLGATEYDFEQRGDVSGLTVLVPYCSGGILRAEKEGYLENWIFTDIREGDEHELNLRPLLSFPLSQVEVIKHTLSSKECDDEEEEDENGLCVEIDTEGESLDDDETALINIQMFEEELGSSETENETDTEESNETSEELEEGLDYSFFTIEEEGTEVHSSEFVYSTILEEDFLEEAVVELLYGADFDYSIKITLVNEEELIGGYEGTVSLVWSGLSDSEKLKFHVFAIDTGDDNYYTLLNGIEEYSSLIPSIEVE